MRFRLGLVAAILGILVTDAAALGLKHTGDTVQVKTAPPAEMTTSAAPTSTAPLATTGEPPTTVAVTVSAGPAPSAAVTPAGPKAAVANRNGLYVATLGGNLVRVADEGYQRPSWSPDGNRLAFRCQQEHLCIVDVGSGVLRRLDGAGTQIENPAWSPDGSTIAFGDDGDLGIDAVNADGSGKRSLAPKGFGPVWSAQGTLAYLSQQADGRLAVMTVRPGAAPVVVAKDAVGLGFPTWSPDGTHLAYVTDGITTIAADGTGEKHLTGSCCAADSDLSLITWSRDGSIYFGDRGNVVAIGADGSGYRAVAANAQFPMVSPDGTRVSFCDESRTYPDGAVGNDVEVADPRGVGRHVIVPMKAEMLVAGPIWSPEGGRVAFGATRLK